MKHFKTISEFHVFRQLPKPLHPLISLIRVDDVKALHPDEPTNLVFDFYNIALKRVSNLQVQYGQQPFDFNEGVLSFIAPGQVIRLAFLPNEDAVNQSGWVLNIHPDFLWNTSLAKTIRQYDFWSYSLHEALFLSEKEEATLNDLIQAIRGIRPTLTASVSRSLLRNWRRCWVIPTGFIIVSSSPGKRRIIRYSTAYKACWMTILITTPGIKAACQRFNSLPTS